MVEVHAVGTLVNLLSSENMTIKEEITWILINISSDDYWAVKEVIEYNTVPVIIEMLKDDNLHLISQNVCNNCIWILGNIAGDAKECREYIINNGVIQVIINLLNKILSGQYVCEIKSLFENILWVLGLIAKNETMTKQPDFDNILQSLLIVLNNYDNISEKEMKEIFFIFIYLTRENIGRLKIVQNNVIPFLMSIIFPSKPVNLYILIFVLRIFGNIIAGSNVYIKYMIDQEILKIIDLYLDYVDSDVVKEVCRIISNICEEPYNFTMLIVSNDNITNNIIIILYERPLECKRECLYILNNIMKHDNRVEILKIFLQKGFLNGLNECLKINDVDLLRYTLNIIKKILEIFYSYSLTSNIVFEYMPYFNDSEIENSLDTLMNHKESLVYQLVNDILSVYFDTLKEEEDISIPNNFLFTNTKWEEYQSELISIPNFSFDPDTNDDNMNY